MSLRLNCLVNISLNFFLFFIFQEVNRISWINLVLICFYRNFHRGLGVIGYMFAQISIRELKDELFYLLRMKALNLLDKKCWFLRKKIKLKISTPPIILFVLKFKVILFVLKVKLKKNINERHIRTYKGLEFFKRMAIAIH